jgi:hypothetical protein
MSGDRIFDRFFVAYGVHRTIDAKPASPEAQSRVAVYSPIEARFNQNLKAATSLR